MQELLATVKQTLLDKGFNEKVNEQENDNDVVELLYSNGGEKYLYCRVYPEDHDWNPAIKETTITQGQLQDKWPTFAWATNGENNFYIDMEEEKSVSKLLDESEIDTATERELDSFEKWSKRIYHKLQKDFDDLHELIYSKRDHVDNSNQAIDEFCKLIFMEVFRINHPDYQLKSGETVDQVVNYNYIEDEPKQAVDAIREAFKEVKGHPDYLAAGEYPIFDDEEYVRLTNS